MANVVNSTILGDTLTKAGVIARRKTVLVWLLAVGVLAGVTGPFGTYDIVSPAPRLAY